MSRTTVFISYARVDIARVREIVAIVRAAGYDPWFDHALLPGQHWKSELLQAIRSCDLFLYALSPESVASEWCQWEFGKAVELRKPVVPVLLQRNTRLEPPLAELHYADFCDGASPVVVAQLIGGLQHATPVPPEEAPAAPENPQGAPAQVITGEGDSVGMGLAPSRTPQGASLQNASARLPFEPETVLVPAGPFLMGSNPVRHPDGRNNELPQHTVTLSDYYIGKYPVTVGEYNTFVEAEGYAARRFWTAIGWRMRQDHRWIAPDFWGDEHWTDNDRLGTSRI